MARGTEAQRLVDDHTNAQPEVGDALGEMLRMAVRGDRTPAVLERDDGFVSTIDPVDYLRPAKEAPPPTRWAAGQGAGRILDAGAGAGSHALAAQAAGHPVTALDVSEGALFVCRERGVQRTVLGSVGDAATLFEPGSFDCVFLLGQNLALLGSPDTAGHVLTVLRTITTPHAVILGDCIDPTNAPAWHRPYAERNIAHGRLPGQQQLRLRWRNLATPWFEYLYLSPAELADLARPHGWELAATEASRASYGAKLRRVN